ncbi:hypothetical protein N7486_011079 [Penicillium sp. IBT 16267x]|nr:hypothetical protein N7486_011079 [Penicillium sp. IBT 16267x]
MYVIPDHQSRIFYIVPSFANPHFTGRKTTLKELQQKLFIQADTRTVALFGLGGIGKTQVALQLAHWVKNHQPDFSTFWVPALSLQSFEQACSQIVKRVGIQRCSDDESAMELVHNHLSSDAAGKWLLIVDNADDHDLLFNELGQYMPASENGNGVILLTTRSREVAVAFASKSIVELEIMTLEEGEAFLTKIVREDLLCDPKFTTQLLEELLFLPLAITQAAFYMSKHGIKISQYLEIMHKTEKDRMNLANLLEFLSYIEPKEIPWSILPALESEEETEFAIGTLCSYAFLTRRDDGNAFDMHDLVQLSTRLWVEKAGHTQQVVQKVIQHMDECFPSDEYYNFESCRSHLPHALKIIRRDESKGISEKYSLLIKVGDCAWAEGREKEALSFFEDASIWQGSQHQHDDGHPDRLFSEHALANAYRSTRQIKRAVQILERVVTARKRTTADEEDRCLLAYQHALAMAYKSDGQVPRALRLFKHVATHALGKAYHWNRQIKEAVRILKHVVMVREKILGKEDRHLLSSQRVLAVAYKSDGQIELAEKILKHVVTVYERTPDEEDPGRLASQKALAKVEKKSKAKNKLNRIEANKSGSH